MSEADFGYISSIKYGRDRPPDLGRMASFIPDEVLGGNIDNAKRSILTKAKKRDNFSSEDRSIPYCVVLVLPGDTELIPGHYPEIVFGHFQGFISHYPEVLKAASNTIWLSYLREHNLYDAKILAKNTGVFFDKICQRNLNAVLFYSPNVAFANTKNWRFYPNPFIKEDWLEPNILKILKETSN